MVEEGVKKRGRREKVRPSEEVSTTTATGRRERAEESAILVEWERAS